MYSLLLGCLLCFFYDILRGLRANVSHSDIAVFFEDIVFWAVAAFATFLFLLVRANGEIRGYVPFSSLLGFVACRLTLSCVFFRVTSVFIRFFIKILRPVLRLWRKATDSAARFCLFCERFFIKVVKKSEKDTKKA